MGQKEWEQARVPFLIHSCFKAPNALLGETIAHFFQSGFRLTIAAQKCIWRRQGAASADWKEGAAGALGTT